MHSAQLLLSVDKIQPTSLPVQETSMSEFARTDIRHPA